MLNFLKGLKSSGKNTYIKGDIAKEIGDSIKVYHAIGKELLFRGVSLNDYNRIKNQGYIDSDMRDAVLNSEGINLAQTLNTATYCLPNNDKGVILAVDPKGLDLYMLSDEYIRIFQDIPIKNIVKVSDIILKNKIGSILSFDTEEKIDEIIKKAKILNIEIDC